MEDERHQGHPCNNDRHGDHQEAGRREVCIEIGMPGVAEEEFEKRAAKVEDRSHQRIVDRFRALPHPRSGQDVVSDKADHGWDTGHAAEKGTRSQTVAVAADAQSDEVVQAAGGYREQPGVPNPITRGSQQASGEQEGEIRTGFRLAALGKSQHQERREDDRAEERFRQDGRRELAAGPIGNAENHHNSRRGGTKIQQSGPQQHQEQ